MLTYTIRRLLLAIPTLLFIALVVFLLLELAPGDPLADQPLTIPPEVREEMRRALGLDQPVHVRFGLWLWQFFVVEPLVLIDHLFGTSFSAGEARVISWQFKTPVMDVIVQRLPQTLWVVGSAYVIGVLIAVPIGIVSAVRQYSILDQIGTFISMVGFSVPTFFTGVLLIVIFSVNLGWFPSIYDTQLG
jgi:peptide/nickel transport system permease protein